MRVNEQLLGADCLEWLGGIAVEDAVAAISSTGRLPCGRIATEEHRHRRPLQWVPTGDVPLLIRII